MILVFDRHGVVRDVHIGAGLEGRLDETDLLGWSIERAFPPERAAERMRDLAEAFERGSAFHEYESNLGGIERVVETRGVRIDDDHALVIVRDITERVRSEAQRRQADQRLHALVSNLNDAVMLLDEGGRIIWASPSVECVIGAPAETLIGGPGRDLINPAGLRLLHDRWERARAMPGVPSAEFEVEGLDSDGATRWYAGSLCDLSHEEGVGGIVLTFRNVTAAHHAAETRRELLRRIGAAEDAERRRLAEGLHDGPVQELAAVTMRLSALRLGLGDDERAAQIQELEEAVRATLGDLRTLMFELQSPDLGGGGLLAALQSCAAIVFEDTSTRVAVEGGFAREPGDRVALTAYRIGREALINARRHACATSVRMTACADGDHLVVSVADDGVGAPEYVVEHGIAGHWGLRTMRERAEAMGGTCTVESRPARGTVVTARLPLSFHGDR